MGSRAVNKYFASESRRADEKNNPESSGFRRNPQLSGSLFWGVGREERWVAKSRFRNLGGERERERERELGKEAVAAVRASDADGDASAHEGKRLLCKLTKYAASASVPPKWGKVRERRHRKKPNSALTHKTRVEHYLVHNLCSINHLMP